MPEANYVTLVPGVPKRLHFNAYAWADTVQNDPLLKLALSKRKLVFVVDQEDGAKVSKTYSTLRGKEWSFWEPFLGDGSFKNFTWELVYSRQDFASEVRISAKPLT